ncbi:IS701 family transposase [Streptomyces sp. NPDC002537]
MYAYGSAHPWASVSVFAETVFGSLHRTDQRRWADAYLKGLLSTPGKKTVRRLATTVSDSPTASQSLHQFVNASPWDWAPVREELTRWTEERAVPRAWVLAESFLRKRGEHSCGVHRRFAPATGRSINCQAAVGAFLATDAQAVPVDWHLHLPGTWAKDPERRQRARIPSEVRYQGIEEQSLDLVDGLTARTLLPAAPVVADASAHTDAGALVQGLSLRGHDFVVAVRPSLAVLPGGHLRLQHHHGGDGADPLEARSVLGHPGNQVRIENFPPTGPGQTGTSAVTTLVRLPHGPADRPAAHRTYRLLAIRPATGRRASQLWLTNMLHRRTDELLALTRLHAQANDTVRHLESDFGLADFEGRSYPGWHHHMTLVSAAYAHCRLSAAGPYPWPALPDAA